MPDTVKHWTALQGFVFGFSVSSLALLAVMVGLSAAS